MNNNLQLLREKQEFQNSGKLYRRSKDHKSEEHWNETRLGGISTNWSSICNNSKIVLLEPLNTPLLYSKSYNTVIFHDLEHCKLDTVEGIIEDISKPPKGFLRVEIVHDPTKYNYSHCNINCYLTTFDGEYKDSLVPHEDYDKHPLKKKLRGLRNAYKMYLMQRFQDKLIP